MKKVVRHLLIASILFFFSGNIIAQIACTWQQGEMLTYSQSNWGDGTSNAWILLNQNFDNFYPIDMVVGTLNNLRFSDAGSAALYLPATGPSGTLTNTILDPLTTSAGELGGEVTALKLNIEFSDAGLLSGSTPLGDLVIHDFTDFPDANGQSIRQIFATANYILGGGSNPPYSASTAAALARLINGSFLNGTPSQFALDHLKRGWSTNDFKTYSQDSYGDGSLEGGLLLASHFFDVYGGPGLAVGSTLTITITNAAAVYTYLPALGTASQLSGSLLNPLSSSSGVLGGMVVALKLNVDFSDAGFTPGTSPYAFGDMVINNSPVAEVNGLTVREFLVMANHILGGDGGAVSPATAVTVLSFLNNSFLEGVPSLGALQYLYYPCSTNHCPTTSSLNVTTAPGTQVLIPLQAADADNDLLTFTITQNPTHGTLFTDADNAVFYTPNAGFGGKDTLLFSVSDGSCVVADTVFISVECPTSTLWQQGDVVTYGQFFWRSDIAATHLLEEQYPAIYAPTGILEIGISGASGYSLVFTDAGAVEDFLLATGTPGSLNADLVNTQTSSSGEFGGEVLALKLNIDFSDAGVLIGNPQIVYGDLKLHDISSFPALEGMTIREVLSLANTLLGGGSGSVTIADMNSLLQQLNVAFGTGLVSQFALDHLVLPCTITPPNHCPVTISSSVTTPLGTSINVQLQASDEDNDALTYSISQNPLHGTVTTSSTGAASYTPTAGYYGTDEFKFKASDSKCESEATVTITIVKCPEGKGYWKNNPNAWPAGATPMLLGTQSYTKNQLLVILTTPVGTGPKADASLILAQQLIPAKLNIANGTQAPASVTGYISSANALIGSNIIPMKVKPSSALGKMMTALASSLESFNNGALSTGCPVNRVIAAASAQRGITSEEVMEVDKELEVKATPNPTNNNFNLNVRTNNLMDKITLQVTDMYGRIIETRNVTANSIVRFGDQYRSGTYFVRIIQGKEHKEIKLVKLN